jgi:hypothetical protein
MTVYERAQEIMAKIGAEGVRVTMDPSTINPPCILIVPPDIDFDLSCGFSVTWRLACLAPAAQGADRTVWAGLAGLVTAARAGTDVKSAELVAYTVNGTSYPAYVASWTESLSE